MRKIYGISVLLISHRIHLRKVEGSLCQCWRNKTDFKSSNICFLLIVDVGTGNGCKDKLTGDQILGGSVILLMFRARIGFK